MNKNTVSTTVSIEVTARDPIVVRDGRPFSSGDRMKSLDWIYPSVFAGSLRTLLGKQCDSTFDKEDIDALKSLKIRGPLPCYAGKIFVPKPLDCVIKEENETYTAFAARPEALREGEGTDLPAGLLPVLLPESVGDEFKPAKTNPFWSIDKMTDWLKKYKYEDKTDTTLPHLQKDERTHVAIQPEMGTARDSQLFSTTALDMTADKYGAPIFLVADITAPSGKFAEELGKLHCLHPLGGERRLAQWTKPTSEGCSLSKIPEALKELSSATHVRMVLATPGIFSRGWCPGWIDEETRTGTIPDSGVKVELVGAVVDRWKPISGWSYEAGKHGPKPVRRLVPAGSVYFFEILEGGFGRILETCWMQSVCDEVQDQNDGFGLAIWGVF